MATELRSEQSPPANDLKRRHSEASEQESKRLRASPGKTSPDPEAARATDAPSEERSRRESTDKTNEGKDGRRKSGAVNEKDRSRRLFGGLLGSLSQKGDSRTAKKRQEIESRKKAELQRQDDERVEDKQRRLEELAAKRRRVREKMDGETMRNRHRNMLHSAHFLHTSAQPRLLYKPWELRPDEEDRIDDQISRAKSQIDQELSEVTDEASNRPDHVIEESREQAHLSPPNREAPVTGASPEPQHATQEKQTSPSTLATTADGSAEASIPKNESATADGAFTSTGETQREEPPETAEKSARAQDDQDDHVVEGEEDTVIY